MATALANMPSPIVLIVAGYIGLRALEIALRPPDSFRTRMAQALMTISAVGLLLMVVLFVLGEIARATGINLIALASQFPWEILKQASFALVHAVRLESAERPQHIKIPFFSYGILWGNKQSISIRPENFFCAFTSFRIVRFLLS